VGLWVTVHLTHELHIAAQGHCLVGRQPCLQDGPVRGPLCGRKEKTGSSHPAVSWSGWDADKWLHPKESYTHISVLLALLVLLQIPSPLTLSCGEGIPSLPVPSHQEPLLQGNTFILTGIVNLSYLNGELHNFSHVPRLQHSPILKLNRSPLDSCCS
jgi:hypothetical protein